MRLFGNAQTQKSPLSGTPGWVRIRKGDYISYGKEETFDRWVNSSDYDIWVPVSEEDVSKLLRFLDTESDETDGERVVIGHVFGD